MTLLGDHIDSLSQYFYSGELSKKNERVSSTTIYFSLGYANNKLTWIYEENPFIRNRKNVPYGTMMQTHDCVYTHVKKKHNHAALSQWDALFVQKKCHTYAAHVHGDKHMAAAENFISSTWDTRATTFIYPYNCLYHETIGHMKTPTCSRVSILQLQWKPTWSWRYSQ